MYLHGFEKRVLISSYHWGRYGSRQKPGHWIMKSAGNLRPIKMLIWSTELFLVLTQSGQSFKLCITSSSQQQWLKYNVQCILDCLTVSVSMNKSTVKTSLFTLRIEEDIWEPQNLASAAVRSLNFTVVSRNYVFADIAIMHEILRSHIMHHQRQWSLHYRLEQTHFGNPFNGCKNKTARNTRLFFSAAHCPSLRLSTVPFYVHRPRISIKWRSFAEMAFNPSFWLVWNKVSYLPYW